MNRWFGVVGFAESHQLEPDKYVERIIERSYYGDVLRNSRNLENSESINDNINVSNIISIVSDPYAELNFHSIRYVEFMGAKWKVRTVDVERPRLKLTIGGVYNGQQT